MGQRREARSRTICTNLLRQSHTRAHILLKQRTTSRQNHTFSPSSFWLCNRAAAGLETFLPKRRFKLKADGSSALSSVSGQALRFQNHMRQNKVRARRATSTNGKVEVCKPGARVVTFSTYLSGLLWHLSAQTLTSDKK